MSTAQLARRLGITRQAAAATESRERDRSITIENLARAAATLDCQVVIAFVPNSSMEDTVRRQAARKSAERRERVVHTMRLEAQQAGVSEALREGSDYWLGEGRRALGD